MVDSKPPVTLLVVTKDGKSVKVGKDRQSGKWYGLTPAVQTFLRNSRTLKPGQSQINFHLNGDVTDRGNKIIDKIYFRNTGNSASTSFNSNGKYKTSPNTGSYDAEKQTEIRRQVALKAAVEVVKVLQGQVERSEIVDVVRGYHETFLEWLNGNTKATVEVEEGNEEEGLEDADESPEAVDEDEGAV